MGQSGLCGPLKMARLIARTISFVDKTRRTHNSGTSSSYSIFSYIHLCVACKHFQPITQPSLFVVASLRLNTYDVVFRDALAVFERCGASVWGDSFVVTGVIDWTTIPIDGQIGLKKKKRERGRKTIYNEDRDTGIGERIEREKSESPWRRRSFSTNIPSVLPRERNERTRNRTSGPSLEILLAAALDRSVCRASICLSSSPIRLHRWRFVVDSRHGHREMHTCATRSNDRDRGSVVPGQLQRVDDYERFAEKESP